MQIGKLFKRGGRKGRKRKKKRRKGEKKEKKKKKKKDKKNRGMVIGGLKKGNGKQKKVILPLRFWEAF